MSGRRVAPSTVPMTIHERGGHVQASRQGTSEITPSRMCRPWSSPQVWGRQVSTEAISVLFRCWSRNGFTVDATVGWRWVLAGRIARAACTMMCEDDRSHFGPRVLEYEDSYMMLRRRTSYDDLRWWMQARDDWRCLSWDGGFGLRILVGVQPRYIPTLHTYIRGSALAHGK